VALLGAATARPDPDTARRLLQRELAGPAYRQSMLERFADWVRELWDRLQQTALHASPLSTGAAVLATAVLVALVVLVTGRARRESGRPPTADGHLLTGAVSPSGHRDAATAALTRGDHRTAVVEAFRALAVRSMLRGLLTERPGLTADELAAELSPLFPGQRDHLVAAAWSFDLAFYGDQTPAAEDARAVLDLDDVLGATRPTRDAVPTGSPTVPR
jgi:hypothetical protein